VKSVVFSARKRDEIAWIVVRLVEVLVVDIHPDGQDLPVDSLPNRDMQPLCSAGVIAVSASVIPIVLKVEPGWEPWV
jgi:hypothetical protein